MQDPTATRFPLSDLTMDAKTAAYIGVLERKVMYQEVLLTQYRALLEALTGDQYEEIDTRMSTDGLKKTATTAFERNLARDFRQAEAMVETNLSASNQEQ